MNLKKKTYRRFLMLPELNHVEKWKLHPVIDHPFFKQGPLLMWQSNLGRSVQINRQLFYMEMRGTMNGDGDGR